MTGADLRAHRKAAGLSQIELARRAGVGRDAVQYWEAKPRLPRWGWATGRLLKALGLPDNATPNSRARGWGLTRPDPSQARLDALAAAERARRRVLCGALTGKGPPCRLLSEPERSRCEFHGGRSTGPRTAEGRFCIAEAQRRRWSAWRALRGSHRRPSARDG